MSDAPIPVRPATPEDAEALVRCFRRGYGDSYVADVFYDADELRARLIDGRLRSVVAADGGEIVGHMGLTLRRPGDTTVDAGNTLVDPAYRAQRLSGRLGLSLGQLCRDAGFLGFHHYPTTAHPVVQKLAVAGGGIEMGVMFDYIPASTDYRAVSGAEAGGPWAVVVVFQPLAPCPPRDVQLPGPYREQLLALYAAAKLERSEASPGTPADATRLEVQPEPRRDLLRLHVERAGPDVGQRVAAECHARPAAVTHADLSLADPGVAGAVAALRAAGFRFCALLPEFRDGDVLRLQRLAKGREPERPDVATGEAAGLLDFIAEDRL